MLVGEYGAVGAEPHPRSLLRAKAPRWALGSGLEIWRMGLVLNTFLALLIVIAGVFEV